MNFIDWKKIFQNIIFSDQAAFNSGKLSEPCCVTCKPEEEYYKNCLIPKFKKINHNYGLRGDSWKPVVTIYYLGN